MELLPFQVFLDEHREEVYRFLACVVLPDEVDDCFQETFLSALRAYPRLLDGSNLRGWVLTIAYRKAMDSHRRRKRRPAPVAEIPERALDTGAESDGLIWRNVRALPPKQRAAVVHRYVNDLPYREIARIAGGSEEAARQSVRQGLRKLKEWMT